MDHKTCAQGRTNGKNTVVYLLETRTVKPPETVVANEWLCKLGLRLLRWEADD
jgi:hypothetical protein